MNSRHKTFLKLLLAVAAVMALFYFNILLGVVFLIILTAIAIYRGRISLYLLMGNSSYSKGQLDIAVKHYKKAYDTGKLSPQITVSYAYLLLKSGKIEESEKILNYLLELNLSVDDEMFTKSNIALVFWKKGELDAAIELLEEVILHYKTSTVYGTLGCFLVLKGDLEKALKINKEAYEYNPSNSIIQDNLGQTYYMLKQYKKSSEVYSTFISTNPTFSEAYYNYGLLLEATEDKEKALDNFRKALKYKLSFMSTITKEEIEGKIRELEEQ